MKLVTVIVLILSCVTGYPQKFSAGYAVTLQNDTINGFIAEGTDAELALQVHFKNELQGGKSTYYQPEDLSGFGFHYGRVFQSMPVTNRPDVKNVFAKRVLRGKITMFSWRKLRRNDVDFFLTNNDSKREVHLTEPKAKTVSDENGGTYLSSGNRFHGSLIYVKADSINGYQNAKKIRYREQVLVHDIESYNERFQESFPVSKYTERAEFTHDLSIGFPIINANDGRGFRMAWYMNKTLPERSRSMSYVRGISYRYWEANRPNKNINAGLRNYRQQYISLLPIGFNLHGDGGRIEPFINVAMGAVILVENYYDIENSVVQQRKTDVAFFPTINLGIGAKLKAGSNAILTEVVPTSNAIYFNVGYSF